MSIFRRSPDAPPLPWPDDSPQGLAARWMRWVAAASPVRSPVSGTTGEHAHRNQPSDVFFLAGTFGTAVTRRCTVPAGTPLFFPLVNQWADVEYGIPEVTGATGDTVVDGEDHPFTEIYTPDPFVVTGAFRNTATGTRKPTLWRIWGLWSHVPPLAPGGHSVRFRGMIGRGFMVDATYEITVI